MPGVCIRTNTFIHKHTYTHLNIHTYIHTYMCNALLWQTYLMKGNNVTVSHLGKIHIHIHTYMHTYIHTYILSHILIFVRTGLSRLEEKSGWQHEQYLSRWKFFFERQCERWAFNWPDMVHDYVCMYVCMYVCYKVVSITGRHARERRNGKLVHLLLGYVHEQLGNQ